jgi:hypothetical protein
VWPTTASAGQVRALEDRHRSLYIGRVAQADLYRDVLLALARLVLGAVSVRFVAVVVMLVAVVFVVVLAMLAGPTGPVRCASSTPGLPRMPTTPPPDRVRLRAVLRHQRELLP